MSQKRFLIQEKIRRKKVKTMNLNMAKEKTSYFTHPFNDIDSDAQIKIQRVAKLLIKNRFNNMKY